MWLDEKEAGTSAGFHHRPVEVHSPAYALDLWWGQLNVRPFSQDLGLDRFAGGVGESFSHQLHRPLGNSTLGFPIADYLSQRER